MSRNKRKKSIEEEGNKIQKAKKKKIINNFLGLKKQKNFSS